MLAPERSRRTVNTNCIYDRNITNVYLTYYSGRTVGAPQSCRSSVDDSSLNKYYHITIPIAVPVMANPIQGAVDQLRAAGL